MLPIRAVPAVGLLALLPVAAYALDGEPLVAIALCNVVLIAASVYVMFLPSQASAEAAAS
jgi:hypothetical protein